MNNQRLDWLSLRRLLWFGLAVSGTLLVTGTIYGALLVPILVSSFITYLLLPFVDRLERLRVPRGLAAFTIIVGSTAIGVFGVVRLAPVLYQQMLLLGHLLPTAAKEVQNHWLPLLADYASDLGLLNASEFSETFGLSNLVSHITQHLQANLAGIWKTGTSVAGGLLYLILIPMLNFFMLKDYPLLARVLGSEVPRDLVGPVHRLLSTMNRTFRSVLKGQVIVAGILGILYIIGFSIVGLQSALLIGFVAGVCRVIPYLDVIVGGTLSAIVLLSNFTGWGQALGVVLVIAVVQAVDGAFVTPRVLGERVGIHPVVLILSVLAFGDWFGFWGVLMAIPVAAMVKVLIVAIDPYYRASRAYLGRGNI